MSNTTDDDKQQSINILMGHHPEQTIYGVRRRINDCLGVRIGEFMNTKQVRVGVFTWNCAGKSPLDDFDLSELVLPEPH